MHSIFSVYHIEVIASIALLTLVIIYIILKKSEKNTHIDVLKKEKNVNATVEKKAEEKNEFAHKELDLLSTNRKKREIVAHDKIVKDDFSIFKSVKILIADDNSINQKVISTLLLDSGIDIKIANNGQEVLDILEDDTDFSLILMDVHMPLIDGFEATKVIRKNPNYNHIPVIALSGDTATDDINSMTNAGMEAHLEKPLRMDALYDIFYTYTTGNESECSSKKISNAPENFNSDKGLSICGGDKNFYLEILNDFIFKYTNSADKLQEYINNTNTLEADKMLLDISGVAANIGAQELQQTALKLKRSLTSPQDLEYITNLKNYKRSLTKVCHAIEEYARTK